MIFLKVVLKVCFWTAVVIVAFIAILDLCLCIAAYSKYKKRTLDHGYQKLNAKVFMSTYHLFPNRYIYYRPEAEWLKWLTYTIIEPSGHEFFPNKTEYYILLNFVDYCRINRFIAREESAKERKRISDSETNAVLEDLQKLTREEIEKAGREVDNALADMRKHMANS